MDSLKYKIKINYFSHYIFIYNLNYILFEDYSNIFCFDKTIIAFIAVGLIYFQLSFYFLLIESKNFYTLSIRVSYKSLQ